MQRKFKSDLDQNHIREKKSWEGGARDRVVRCYLVDGLFHGRDDGRVLALPQVIVGAPNRDGFRFRLAFLVEHSFGESARLAFNVGKDSVATFFLDVIERFLKAGVVLAKHIGGIGAPT